MSVTETPGSRKRWPFLALLAGMLLFSLLVIWQTVYWTREFAYQAIRDRSEHTLNLVAENLRGALATYQYQPRLLSRNPALVGVLKDTASPAEINRANLELERINDVTGALDTYLMDQTGMTLAASNWSSDRTFIGRNFGFRPYFQAGLKGSMGRYFALGTTSGERGYYFSYPVRTANGIAGVVVVKMDLGSIEAQWRTPDHEILVVDGDGVVFLSSFPDWHFRTLQPLSPEARSRLDNVRRYPGQALESLPVHGPTADGLMTIDALPGANKRGGRHNDRTEFLVQERAMRDADWRVLILARTAKVQNQTNIAGFVAIVALASLFLSGNNIFQKIQRSRRRSLQQEEAKRELEERVRERTSDLTDANLQLREEIGERENAEAELHQAQADLVQATKLAALGQMSAGLSHELNQPLAAIRSYADNARVFLDRADAETAQSNLSGISELTERMARIIKNLKTAAHEEPIAVGPTLISPALNEALTMLDGRLRSRDVEVVTNISRDDLCVVGGDVRMQQIFLNLIGNAIDAMAEAPERRITISAEDSGEQVSISVADTGTGIAEPDFAFLFDPFFSTKKVGQGMGLGLFIAYGLIKQFGGDISVANNDDGGAIFSLSLVRAEPEGEHSA
jgi:two-component system, NtrC family, C4-dicarboxylate transport sensor histidine kinase DctB